MDARRFHAEVVTTIDGWLEPFCALWTMALLDAQARHGIGGGLLEIGVYRGRYLAILLRAGIATGEHVVGIDTFEHVPQTEVEAGMRRHFGDGADRLRLIAARSDAADPAAVREALGAPARFISVDGSHEVADVVHDMGLAAALVAPKGVVAADDFLNPLTLGVNEGVNRYLATGQTALAPFAYAANKLFLCAPDMTPTYKAVFQQFCEQSDEPRAAAFRESRTKWQGFVEQPLFGHRVMIVP